MKAAVTSATAKLFLNNILCPPFWNRLSNLGTTRTLRVSEYYYVREIPWLCPDPVLTSTTTPCRADCERREMRWTRCRSSRRAAIARVARKAEMGLRFAGAGRGRAVRFGIARPCLGSRRLGGGPAAGNAAPIGRL